MSTEFDPEKDRKNRAKHGLPLALGSLVIEDAMTRGAVVEDLRRAYGERRYVAYGRLNGRLLVCVFTLREDRTRIVSLRKANSKERDVYG